MVGVRNLGSGHNGRPDRFIHPDCPLQLATQPKMQSSYIGMYAMKVGLLFDFQLSPQRRMFLDKFQDMSATLCNSSSSLDHMDFLEGRMYAIPLVTAH